MFLLPAEHKSISIQKSTHKNPFLFKKLFEDISKVKSKIENKNYLKSWDKAKRKVNPYELVHILGTNQLTPLCHKKYYDFSPLSRAFFKMIEIYDLGILPKKYLTQPGSIAHLAEGPGGFIEAVYQKRKKILKKEADEVHAITLHNHSKSIPGWAQLQRRKNHPLHCSSIKLHTGDLYSLKTIFSFSRNFQTNKAFLVTCDGGFDYSGDFNNQESSSLRIVFCEIVTALKIQEKGGTLVCKMFDLFTHFSVEIIYLLTTLYEKVFFFKPQSSRPANSEKYLVAQGYKGVSKITFSILVDMVENWENDLGLGICVPKKFVEKIREYLILFLTRQKKYIHQTLRYIETPDEEKRKFSNQKQFDNAREWFKKHSVSPKKVYKNSSSGIKFQRHKKQLTKEQKKEKKSVKST